MAAVGRARINTGARLPSCARLGHLPTRPHLRHWFAPILQRRRAQEISLRGARYPDPIDASRAPASTRRVAAAEEVADSLQRALNIFGRIRVGDSDESFAVDAEIRAADRRN